MKKAGHPFAWLGARLKAARIARCLTVAELAQGANVSRALVSAWESGARCPTPQSQAQLRTLLSVSVDYFAQKNDHHEAELIDPYWVNSEEVEARRQRAEERRAHAKAKAGEATRQRHETAHREFMKAQEADLAAERERKRIYFKTCRLCGKLDALPSVRLCPACLRGEE